MKISNKLLLGATTVVVLFTVAAVLRLGVFFFMEQPEHVFFSKHDETPTTRTIPVKDFHSVQLEGFWKVKISRGPAHAVVVKAAGEMHRRMTVAVSDGTLRVLQNYFSLNASNTAEITITMPSIKALHVRGGNEVDFSGFQDRRTAIDTRGLIDFKGRACGMQSLRLSGVGLMGIDLSNCRVRDADLNLVGMGEVNLHMTGGELKGKIDSAIGLVHKGPLIRKAVTVNREPRWGKSDKSAR